MADVHSLRVFVAVAEKMSLTRAGEALGLTQPAVSHQLAKLESEYRVKLLERHGRTITLTPAGAELKRSAGEIIQRMDDLGNLLRTAADPGRGTLRIGATVTACQYLLPDPIRELRECFPGYAVNVLPGDSPVVSPWLASGHVDMGIIIRGDYTARLPTRKLFSDQLGLVCHPRHAFAMAEKVSAADLVDQQWVMYNPGSATFGIVERHFTKLRVPLGSPIELGSVEAIKELVKVGLGTSVLARWVVRNELAEGSLVWRPLPGPKLVRDWVIALPPHRTARMVEESAAEFCQSAAMELSRD